MISKSGKVATFVVLTYLYPDVINEKVLCAVTQNFCTSFRNNCSLYEINAKHFIAFKLRSFLS